MANGKITKIDQKNTLYLGLQSKYKVLQYIIQYLGSISTHLQVLHLFLNET